MQFTIIILGSLVAFVLIIMIRKQFGFSKQMRNLAMTDALTGVANRRSLEKIYIEHIQEVEQKNKSLSIIVFDLDHFKSINDRFGHGFGDEVLIAATKACEKVLREKDTVGRIGGEEFMILLPITSIQQAKEVAERVRIEIENLKFESSKNKEVRVTTSLGVAEYRKDEEFSRLIARADKALYAAKDAGRNQTVLTEE